MHLNIFYVFHKDIGITVITLNNSVNNKVLDFLNIVYKILY